MRIIHLTTTPDSLEFLLGPQLQAMVEAGHEVIGVSAPGGYLDRLAARGVSHVALGSSTRAMSLRRDLGAARQLATVLRRIRPDVLHTHTHKPGFYGRIVGRALRVPAVVNTVHGLYATSGDRWSKRTLVHGAERLAAMCSDAELVQNPEDLATLTRLGVPARRLHLLGNGVDLDRFRAGPDAGATRRRVRAELGVDEDVVLIGTVGRLVYEKGYRELFAAAAALARRTGTRARVVAVGPGEPDKGDGVDAAALAAAKADGVLFLGHRSDVHALYHGFDAFVLASYREGFPRSAMEAAAAGLPLVLTDIRGCRQVVDDGVNGLLVPKADASALLAALERLVDDPALRSRLGLAAVDKATREFDQRRQIELSLATYERVLAGRVRTPRSGG